MKQFQAGKSYTYRLATDSSNIYEVKIIRRTAKTVWISDDSEPVKRCKIHNYNDSEFIYPSGQYSMCPIVEAN